MVSRVLARRVLWALALLPALLPCAQAKEDAGEASPTAKASNGCTKLAFKGAARFDEDIGALGQFEFDFDLRVVNRTEGPIVIRRANLLLGHQGGWLTPLDPESLDGSFFRGELPIAAAADEAVAVQPYKCATPAIHAVLVAHADDGHCIQAIAIDSDRYRPAPAEFRYPHDVAVVGPLHVVPFADGEDSVLFIGQHQVFDDAVPTDVSTEIIVSSDKGGSQPVKWKGFDAEGDLVMLWPFARRVPVFKDFERGVVGIHWSFRPREGEEPVTVAKSWPVERVQPVLLRAPVSGTWQLSNGPGSPRFHDHYASPQHRYAYDLVQVGENGRTHRGTPNKNESYFAWGKGVLAAADGEIVAFCDHMGDNPGYSQSKQCALNYIVVKHANEVFTAYLHLRHRSRAQGLRVGARVREGDQLAQVGNSGESSEPHLHFMAFTVDGTGRIASLPVTFGNAFHDSLAKRPVKGVPLGGRLYFFQGR